MDHELRTWPSVRAIGRDALSEVMGPDTPPFLRFEWLDALERTGLVEPERGWMPMHVTLHTDDRLVAFAPCYVKGNSEGEFVFDHGWARFCEGSLSRPYYPKLLLAVPFTPATGERLLVRPGVERGPLLAAFADGVRRLSEKLGVSSAHILFPPESDAAVLEQAGLCRRLGLQFHWHAAGYARFEEFLERFSAKRRHQIRRERREALKTVEIEVLTGSDLTPALADFVFDFYASTVDQHVWGRRYLSRAFFEEVLSTMPEALHVVAARDRSSKTRIAGAFNLLGRDALYGRYWGALAERRFVHFEVCFYRGIEEAIERGLSRFEPGAGGEHKLFRGFEPTATHSLHHLCDPRLDRAVRDFLDREQAALSAEMARAREEMGFRPVESGRNAEG